MTRSFFAAALIAIAALAAPRPAAAQHTAPSGSTSSGTAVSSGGGSSSGGSSSGGSSSSSGSSGGSSDFGSSSNNSGRQRGNAPVSGRAVPRTGQSGGGPIRIGVGGFYPWGYAFGAGIGAGIYNDGFYGGYYGAYDPWYGFSPIYAPSSYARNENGSIRLKVKPSNATVYVDGYYVGLVDDFDGSFQRLRLEPGPHHLEIRAIDHASLSVDVWITEDLTITYRGDLSKQ